MYLFHVFLIRRSKRTDKKPFLLQDLQVQRNNCKQRTSCRQRITVASLFGLQKGLALLLLCMGFQKSLRAKDYYNNTQKKWAIASLVVGVSACICGFLSFTNLI